MRERIVIVERRVEKKFIEKNNAMIKAAYGRNTSILMVFQTVGIAT